VFAWIAEHQNTFYRPRKPIDPVGVYFSPTTRNYFSKEFLASYQGTLLLLIQAHREYEVVTPRTLASFHGKTLVLPDVRILSKEEADTLRNYVAGGRRIIAAGASHGDLPSSGVTRVPESPGSRYLTLAERNFEGGSPDSEKQFLDGLDPVNIQVNSSPMVATQIASVDGKTHIFFANFQGLRSKENAFQTPERHAEVTLPGKQSGHFLPFLGEEREISGHFESGSTHFNLPEINKGAAVWFEPAETKK
jgi:hypothetical protein